MDIKLRNIRYSRGAKITAVIIVWLGFLAAMGSSLFLWENRGIAGVSNYARDSTFQNDFATMVHDTVEYHVVLKSEANIKNASTDAKTTANNLQRLHQIEKVLPTMVNFVYYVRNTQTGENWTNLDEQRLSKLGSETVDPVRFIQEQPTTVFLGTSTIEASVPFSQIASSTEDMPAGSPYEVYAAVVGSLHPGDMFYNDFVNFMGTKTSIEFATMVLIIAFVLAAAAFIFLIYVTGRRDPEEEDMPGRVKGMYTDVHTLLVFIAAVISLCIAPGTSTDVPKILTIVALAVVLSLDVFIGLSYVLSMVRQFRAGQLFTNTLLYKLGSSLTAFLRLAFQGKVFKGWMLLLLFGYGIINGLIFILLVAFNSHSVWPEFLFILLVFLAFNAGVAYFSARSLAALAQIMVAVKEISAGNLDYTLSSNDIPASFAAFAEDIRSLQGGLQKAVAQAVKGERMKTDLITNVSHDLKTPLTSIINYVDLLKREELNNETAAGYVEILEEKSFRLKQLIEDLVEASKASSGNLAMTGEKVNLHELMMQACGEYQEKMQQAQLDLHMPTAGEAVVVWADGKYMWRIAENLLSNVIKYSLPHSRVYIDISSENGYGSFTIKNISAFPLNISPEQLTERFVRGDESRSTEGSGLGLSISQSLTGLQGGKFQLEIDGDLFKVTVAIPLWEE
ncbi:MAG TPA: HAMP domain-containing sensor histidine kinase [Syntrophomonadaceae bacterium]|nr:HAMP domain-containing sensor histidine kinase [Syntrophomonadaceae bacterium]